MHRMQESLVFNEATVRHRDYYGSNHAQIELCCDMFFLFF